MKKKVKRFLTLIELLISITLTALILTTLLYFYQQITVLNIKYDRDQKESFEKRYVENRLSNVLSRAISAEKKNKDFNFFTMLDTHGMFKNNSPSLIFTFDNGVDLDKEFSNHVLARLYLSEKGELTLGIWPSPELWSDKELPPMKKEILMENIDSISFQFFIPQEKQEKVSYSKPKLSVAKEPFPKLSWVKKWEKSYKQLPAIVKIEIRKKMGDEMKTYNFAYPLPNVTTPIVYSR